MEPSTGIKTENFTEIMVQQSSVQTDTRSGIKMVLSNLRFFLNFSIGFFGYFAVADNSLYYLVPVVLCLLCIVIFCKGEFHSER